MLARDSPATPRNRQLELGGDFLLRGDPTLGVFLIIELNSSDKFRFFGSVVGKAKKLYHVKLNLLPSSANNVSISRLSIEILAPGQDKEPYMA